MKPSHGSVHGASLPPFRCSRRTKSTLSPPLVEPDRELASSPSRDPQRLPANNHQVSTIGRKATSARPTATRQPDHEQPLSLRWSSRTASMRAVRVETTRQQLPANNHQVSTIDRRTTSARPTVTRTEPPAPSLPRWSSRTASLRAVRVETTRHSAQTYPQLPCTHHDPDHSPTPRDHDVDMAWVYILLCADGSFYVGSTTNLELRLEQHMTGRGAVYTRQRLPGTSARRYRPHATAKRPRSNR